MQNYKISVIMANYNHSKYLPISIFSVMSQTYKNIELIIIDDKSTDNSREIIIEHANKYDNIKYIFLEENKGAYNARNKGLEISTGDFITLLDPDDIFLVDRLNNCLLQYMIYQEQNKNFEILFSNIYRLKCNIINESNYHNIKELVSSDMKLKNNKSIGIGYHLGMATIFVKRSFFTKYGMWRSDYYYGMDAEILQRYLLLKYKKRCSYSNIWNEINKNKCTNFGIIKESNANYISQPMTSTNATSLLKKTNLHHIIHKKCDQDLISETYEINYLKDFNTTNESQK